MRALIDQNKTGLMRYGIREIVETAQQLQAIDPGIEFAWENIGDPVAKGWETPDFVKDILCDLIKHESKAAFSYSHSRGNFAARQWAAELSRALVPSSALDPEKVLFVNGLGAGISLLYRVLGPKARIIQPNPGYPTHISSERFSAGAPSIGYNLDPKQGWQPDLEHLESQIKKHPEVKGILIINPNNPTGTVYSKDVLTAIVEIAERYRLILISDEIYFRMVYQGTKYTHLTELVGKRLPLIVMRGMSKDIPWPGGRCGWLEFHNTELNQAFFDYFENLKMAAMLEVCAATLPQLALPRIYDHSLYPEWQTEYVAGLQVIADETYDFLLRQPGIVVNRIQGAFYMTTLFEDGVLNPKQTLSLKHEGVKRYIETVTNKPGLSLDKRFAFYLLAATGICVVPATDFESSRPGFRVTTLNRNPASRQSVCQRLVEAIGEYLASA